ncbi:acetyl-CoA C-acyltransferase [Flavobacteriaceae bacterium]|nr:acetyl-CoA C-acyltransferase [Flavobacteriaceae bacterium]
MEAYIVAGYRSAIGKAKRGGFKNYRTDDLAVDVIKHLSSQVPELDTTKVDDVIVGCANPEGEQGLQVARLISARALGKEVPGVTINRYCASGLEAISMAVSKVRAGFGDIFIAGGIESMSLLPMTGYKLAPSYKANMENMNYHIGMGHTAEAVAEKYKITREASDKFSYESHLKAANAIDKGYFKDQIVPVTVEEVFVKDGKKVSKSHTVDMDEGVRRETTIEALAKLRPAFKLGKDLRRNIKSFEFLKGEEVASAQRSDDLNYANITFHTDWLTNIVETRTDGDKTEELLIHESAHLSIDPYVYGQQGWTDAVNLDGNYLSTYAKDNPNSEDIAETFQAYIAVKYFPDRISNSIRDTILSVCLNRFKYFDSLNLDLSIYK